MTIPILPPTDNHLYGQRGKIRFMYKEAKDWKALVNLVATNMWKDEVKDCKMEAKVTFYLTRERDIQGSLKLLFDALEDVVYDNDKRIWRFEVEKFLDEESKLNPRVELEVYEANTNQA